MAEYKTDLQKNYGWGLTLNMTGKAPAVSKRIFKTLADAQAYVDDAKDSAIEGLRLSVIADTNERNNGVYFVKSIGTTDGPAGVLEKLGASPALTAKTYEEAQNLATADNVGQIIVVKEGDKKGIYVVTGAGTLDGLGTSSVSDALAERVETLETTVGKLDGKDAVDGSIKKQIKDADEKVRKDFADADRALEEKITAVETAAKAAHTKVSDKANGHVNVSTTTDDTTGKQTVTISEKDIASAEELNALTTKVGNEATTGDTATEATGLYKYVDDKVAGVPKYKVVKNDTTGGFNLVADGNAIDGSVEIGFKDYVVRSGKVVRCSWNEGKSEFAESEDGDVTAIKLVLNVKDPKTGTDGEETIYIDATSLVDTYTVASESTKYISINGYEIALTKDFIETIGKVATIETGLGELKTNVEALDSNSLKEITVNGHTINSGATSANIVTGEIKTGADIKLNESDETPVVKSGKTIDEVVKGIYTQINNLNGSKVESVTAVENSGVKVDNTDKKNPKISLELEEHTNDTVAAGHIELQVDAKTGKLYGVMYYDTTDPESVSGTTA